MRWKILTKLPGLLLAASSPRYVVPSPWTSSFAHRGKSGSVALFRIGFAADDPRSLGSWSRPIAARQDPVHGLLYPQHKARVRVRHRGCHGQCHTEGIRVRSSRLNLWHQMRLLFQITDPDEGDGVI